MLRKLLSLLLLLSLASCSSIPLRDSRLVSLKGKVNQEDFKGETRSSNAKKEQFSFQEEKRRKKTVEYIQLGQVNLETQIWQEDLSSVVDLLLRQIPKTQRNIRVKLQLEEVTLEDFINSVFGKILKVNYILDDSVKRVRKKITINLQEEIPLKKFLYLVLKLLSNYGVQPVLDKQENLIKFVFSKERRFISVPIYVGALPKNVNDDEYVMYIYPVKYVDITNYHNFITKYIIGNYATIDYFDNNSFMLVYGKAIVIKRLNAFLRFIDKPVYKKKNIAIVELDYINSDEFIEKVKPLLINQGVKVSNSPIESGLFIYPVRDKIVLISPKKEWIDLVLKWKKFLDNPDVLASSGFFVYKPRNRNASELAELLTKMKSKLDNKGGQNLTVILDKTRNQLVINASPKLLRNILKLLKQLDTLPKQVLVETTIAEITLKDQLQYGLEWYLKNGGYLKGEGGTLGALGLGAAGFTYSLVTKTQKFQMILNAFAKKNLINILSSPHLVVLNGKSADINVGTEVPVISSEVSAPDVTGGSKPSILRNVQYRSTGVHLSIQPSIISDDTVELKVSQSVSDAQSNNLSKIDSPIILNRSISTDIVVRSGESVVLGGLISTNLSHTTNKVPGISEIPIVGNLFKTESKGSTKTELVVIITPYVLSSAEEYVNMSSKILEALFKIDVDAKLQLLKQ